MSGPTVLIADPNRARMNKVRDACADMGLRSVALAGTLADAYQMAEELEPRRVAIAAEFTRTDEFGALMQLFELVRTRVFLFGDGRAAAGQPVHLVDTPGALATFAATLSSGLVQPKAPPTLPQPQNTGARGAKDMPLILIGASTGGVSALEEVLLSFPTDCPPTLVVQHMRAGFGPGLVQRLDATVPPRIVEAADGNALLPGVVHVAAGNGSHLGLLQRGGLVCALTRGAEVSGHCPSVDVLFQHGAALAEQVEIRAALLTGMGADGADGLRRLRAAGAHTIAQDKDSSVVWGMPRVAIEMGAAVEVLPLRQIARGLLTGARKTTSLNSRSTS